MTAVTFKMSQEKRNQQPTHSPVRAITPVFLLLFAAAIIHPLCSAPLPPSAPIPKPSSPYNKTTDFVWPRILKRLRRRRGYHNFSYALDSVIPSLNNVDLVTVFAPRQFWYNNSETLHNSMEEVVRYHMVFGRYDFSHLVGLASASNETWLMSLVCGRSVKLTSNLSVAARDMRVNDDIEILDPDLIVSKNVVVHGISTKLDIPTGPS